MSVESWTKLLELGKEEDNLVEGKSKTRCRDQREQQQSLTKPLDYREILSMSLQF